jgi:hypothetical protein
LAACSRLHIVAAMMAVDMTVANGNGDVGRIADVEKSNP